MRAKKSLGQHFLRSERALSTIIETGFLVPGETVLEIGPGEGVLTGKLLEARARVIAVEKDDELSNMLREKFEKEIVSKQLILINTDILDFDIAEHLPRGTSYKIMANIPYNITGAILKKFLEGTYLPEKMVLLVQKEVADRIVARDRKESILSISVKSYGTPRYIEVVKAGSFAPRPQVDSAIISIDNISKDFFHPPTGKLSEKGFFDLVRAGFQSKRKKLVSNLAILISKERLSETFKKLGLDENARAEDLSLKTWREIACCVL